MPSMNIALLSGSLEKHFFKLLAIKKGVQVHIYGIVLSDQVLKWVVAKSVKMAVQATHTADR
jgi:hypothetical protein